MTSKAADRVEDEVLARYVAATSGDAGPEALRAFDAWVAAEPERQRAASQLHLDAGETVALRGLFMTEIARLRRRRVRRRRSRIAALCAAAMALLVVTAGTRTSEVPPGSAKSITLADGSTALVAGGGALEIPLAPWARSVRLLRGEALFTVAHDAERPFLVRCGDAEIQDIGTRFVVRADGAATSVAVFEGAVQLGIPGDERLLDAGQAAVALPSAIVTAPAETEADATAWKSGRMVFRDLPLEVAAIRLSTAWGRPVRVNDAKVASLQVSGDFRLDDPAAVLRGLSLTLPVAVRESRTGIDLLPR